MEIAIVAGATCLAGLAIFGFATFAECSCPNALVASVVSSGAAATSLIIFEFWPIVIGFAFAVIAYLPFLVSKGRAILSDILQEPTTNS